MHLFFQHEDDRAVMHDIPPDAIITAVLEFLAPKFHPEIFYAHRWMNGYEYDGTLHSKNETILFQVRDNMLYYLPRSKKGNFVEGKPLVQHKESYCVPISDIV